MYIEYSEYNNEIIDIIERTNDTTKVRNNRKIYVLYVLHMQLFKKSIVLYENTLFYKNGNIIYQLLKNFFLYDSFFQASTCRFLSFLFMYIIDI